VTSEFLRWATLASLLIACEEPIPEPDDTWNKIQSLSPMGELPDDPTNAVFLDPAAAALGEQLFFDTRLSADGTVSCATCHQPEHGFADPNPLSETLGTTDRHTPSVINAAWNRWFFWDGRADSLWAQALQPIEHPAEHGFSRLEVVHKLSEDTELTSSYAEIFGEYPDFSDPLRFPAQGMPVFDEPDNPLHQAWMTMNETDQQRVNRTFVNVGKALAAFEGTVTGVNSPFDRYVQERSQGQSSDALNAESIEGLELFVGRAGCIQCHSGPTLSDLQFHNIGLAPVFWADPTDVGRYEGITALLENPFNGTGDYSDDPEAGAKKLSYLYVDAEKLGQFKTPTLRNIDRTAPYMHTGQLATLEEVVRFYNDANQIPSIGHREEIVVPLNLTEQEQAALVSFLKSLTDPAYP
jgi:cytochrome c peroxidase